MQNLAPFPSLILDALFLIVRFSFALLILLELTLRLGKTDNLQTTGMAMQRLGKRILLASNGLAIT